MELVGGLPCRSHRGRGSIKDINLELEQIIKVEQVTCTVDNMETVSCQSQLEDDTVAIRTQHDFIVSIVTGL